MKHFRQQGYDIAYTALQRQTRVHLEHPLVSELYEFLVVKGDYEKSERFIGDCIDEGLMDDYLNRQDYRHAWHEQPIQNDYPGFYTN